MTSISNLYSNLDESKKLKVISIGNNYDTSTINTTIPTYSLSQGEKFKKYQNKITSNLDNNVKNINEGFQARNNNDNSARKLTKQSNKVLQETDISNTKIPSTQWTVQNSKWTEYLDYFNSVNPSPYLNKTVGFTSGHIAYVTNQGVVKYVPTMEIWSSSKIPTDYIKLDIPWDNSYSTPGTIIPLSPHLISGTFLPNGDTDWQQETNNLPEQTIETLQENYDTTLGYYNKLITTIQDKIKGFFDRVSPSNPYLGKNVCLTNGACGYVTQKGVFKWYPSDNNYTYDNTAGKNGCPNTPYEQINGEGDINQVGASISTNPPLIVGTPMVAGQSCGAEGSNVFVNKYLSDNVVPKYEGCYADNTNSPLMTFIGGAPPPPTALINGDFSQPQIGNDSYKYVKGEWNIIPGWYFNAVLVNNSKIWRYPMPYPSGNQCVSIQNAQHIIQTVNLQSGVTYTLSLVACGRPGYSGSNPITIHLYTTSNKFIKEVYNFKPVLNVWTNYTTNFTVETSQNTGIHFVGNMEHGGDYSSALANIQLTTTGASTSSGSYTYDQCKQAAISIGYQYFALQGVNADTSQGYCAVSNSQPTATSLGESMVVNGSTALWASNTSETGNTAILTTTGSLSVINSGGTSVFSTDNSTAQPGNYFGCYYHNDNPHKHPKDECEKITKERGSKYYGMSLGRCNVHYNISDFTKTGKANNCVKDGDTYTGGSHSYAVYGINDDSMYYLYVEENGEITVNRGSGPNDNQGNIWSSGTKDKSQEANPLYAAAKGKYGKNWIASGSTLAAGDFVGSNDGKTVLMMQSDGNLVLYTWSLGTNCQQMADGNMGAGPGGNALYGFSENPYPKAIGKLAYIDENTQIHNYPSDNVKLLNTYTQFQDINSPGYDIPGAAYNGATVDQCKSTCDNNSECAGFVYEKGIQRCWPKYIDMFPKGQTYVSSDNDVYIKNRQPATTPRGVSNTTFDIDTVTYQNYPEGGNLENQYGLANATSVQKQQLTDFQSKMNLLANQINNLTNKFEYNGSKVDNQANINIEGSKENVNELNVTNKKIQIFPKSLDLVNGMLDDSDISVLQRNYEYLLWTILAAGTLLVSMNIVKK